MTTDTHSRRLAVGYARLSVTVDDSTSIARQKADIEKLAEAEDLAHATCRELLRTAA